MWNLGTRAVRNAAVVYAVVRTIAGLLYQGRPRSMLLQFGLEPGGSASSIICRSSFQQAFVAGRSRAVTAALSRPRTSAVSVLPEASSHRLSAGHRSRNGTHGEAAVTSAPQLGGFGPPKCGVGRAIAALRRSRSSAISSA